MDVNSQILFPPPHLHTYVHTLDERVKEQEQEGEEEQKRKNSESRVKKMKYEVLNL